MIDDETAIRIFMIDRDAQRCAARMTAYAREAIFTETRSAASIDAIYSSGASIPFDVLFVSPDRFERSEIEDMIRDVRSLNPGLRVVAGDLEDDVEQILQYLMAGAWGYTLRRESSREELQKIRAIARGDSVISPSIGAEIIARIHQFVRLNPGSNLTLDTPAQLTPREREVLGMIARKMTNREIAEELILEVGTVKNHVHNVLDKLGVSNRFEAAEYGLQADSPLRAVLA
jgi:DNA-binding NarL/FixJ family response regulator